MTRTRHAIAPLICSTLALGLAAGQPHAAEKKAFTTATPPTPAVAAPPVRALATPQEPASRRREAEAETRAHPRATADKYEQARKRWGGRAAKGDADAQLRLGRTYRRGKDTKANAKHALHWLRAAARANLPAAHYQLGLFHMAGAKGRPSDLVEAYARFRIAADAGDVRAAALVFYIGVRMTADELRQSHERIAEIRRFRPVPTAPPSVVATEKPADETRPDTAAKPVATKSAAAEPAGTAAAKTAAPASTK